MLAGLGVRKDYYRNCKIYYVIEGDSISQEDLETLKSGNACDVRNPLPMSLSGEELARTVYQAGDTIQIAGKEIPVLAGTTYIFYEETDRQLEESFEQIRLLAWGFILFVGLIGPFNTINTVYTNIHTIIESTIIFIGICLLATCIPLREITKMSIVDSIETIG